MSSNTVSKSRISRVLSVIARVGLDLRPLAQHIRAAIIRPVRHELAQSSTDIRNEIAREAAAAQSEIVQLRRDLAQAAASSDELTARVSAQQLATGAQIAQLRRDLEQVVARNEELTARLTAQGLAAQEQSAQLRRDWEQAVARNEELTARLTAQGLAAQEQIAQLRRDLELAAARTDELTAKGLAAEEELAQLQAGADLATRARVETAHGLDALRSGFDRLEAELGACRSELGPLQTAATDAVRTARELSVVGKKASDLSVQLSVLERIFTEHAAFDLLPRDAHVDSGPVVSVILPTRNRAHVIAAAVTSVQAQRYPHWELIIIDDGSTDATAESLAPFLRDKRIRVVRQPPLGAAAARNHGLKLARGSVIAYLDSDNVWYPAFLAAAVAAFRNPDVEVAYGALISKSHGLDGTRILYKPFDRTALLDNNFIDINTLVHRRELVDRYGGFDERLDRLMDWDLVLRYTADRAATMLPVLAALYGGDEPDRITTTAPAGSNLFVIRNKWRVLPETAKHLRLLYAIGHCLQPGERLIEAEIQCMLRWGVHVEVWCETGSATPFRSSVPVHRGTLDEAIAAARPDLLHVDRVDFGHQQAEVLERHGLPSTVRAHGFALNADILHRILACPWMRRVYLSPHQQAALGVTDPRVRGLTGVFDTALFKPHAAKDRQLVALTGAGPASNDLGFVFELAKTATAHRFVVAVVTCKDTEGDIDVLRNAWRRSGTPAELMINLPRAEVAALVARAGLYLHTMRASDEPSATSISIAEAMATGSHVLVRDIPALVEYVADAGVAYRDIDHAANILHRTAQWSDSDWQRAWTSSVERAFSYHADETVLLPLLQDWCEISVARTATQRN